MKKSIITLCLVLGLLSANASMAYFYLTGKVGEFSSHSLKRTDDWSGVSWFYLEGANIADFKQHCGLHNGKALIAIYPQDTLVWTMVLQAKSQGSSIKVAITNGRKIAGHCTVDSVDLL